MKLKASPKGHCNGISSKGRHQSETGVNGAVSWEMFGKYPGNFLPKIFHLFHFPTPCCPGNSPETEIKYRTIKKGHWTTLGWQSQKRVWYIEVKCSPKSWSDCFSERHTWACLIYFHESERVNLYFYVGAITYLPTILYTQQLINYIPEDENCM